jgi:hypothetical protein
MNQSSNSSPYSRGGLALIGCIIAGVGVGWLAKPELMVPGAVIGLGIGLVVMAIMARST